jgi:hypothetical protein
MTHSTVTTAEENSGSFASVYHTINITSLDNAGSEDYTPTDELALRDALGVSINGQESDDLFIRWDHVDESLTVTNASDGTTVAQGTDVGEVVLKVDGNRAP